MKALNLRPSRVDIKVGDRVDVLKTFRWPHAWSCNSSTASHEHTGIVISDYKHINAIVVKTEKGTLFIRENDSRYSVWKR